MKKKWLTAVLAAAAVSIFLINPLTSWSAEKGPIKIGFLSPLSGGMAANGKDMLAGAQLYLEEIKYQAAGRKIELLVEDDEANPAVGLTKSRKLVEKDGVHLMTGGLMASTAYALAPYIDSQGIPMTYPIMSADDITQRKIPKWIVRTGWTSGRPISPLASMPTMSSNSGRCRSLRTTSPSAGSAWAASTRPSRTQEGRSSRRSGYRSPPRI